MSTPFFTTLRQTRRLFGVWLLGVLLVLLPLRGWAEVAMHLGGQPESSAAAAQMQAGHGAESVQPSEGSPWVPPCHAVMADASAAGQAADPGQGCSLCALCHASALCADEVLAVSCVAGLAAPSAVPAGHRQPALPQPERPPKS